MADPDTRASAEAAPLKADDARTTYRYLRIGMIAAVVLLTASIAFEYRNAPDCLQTSISAYYYTPVRAIFVGSMMAVGLALIVYRGRSPWEDACLNFSGVLAPVVAIAPTTDVGRCWSVAPQDAPVIADGSLAPWVRANIDNNLNALVVTGVIGLVVTAVLTMRDNGWKLSTTVRRNDWATGLSLAGSLAALVFVLWWRDQGSGDFYTQAHGYAAALMFAFLIGAIIAAAREEREHQQRWSRRYWVVAILMIAGGIAALAGGNNVFGDHVVLYLEAYEIGLFALYWSLQTAEKWDEDVVLLAGADDLGHRQDDGEQHRGAEGVDPEPAHP